MASFGLDYNSFLPAGTNASNLSTNFPIAQQRVQGIIGGINGATGFNQTRPAVGPNVDSVVEPLDSSAQASTGVYYTNGSSGASAAPTYDPQAQAYYQDQISGVDSQLGRLDNQANIGSQNILDAYNAAFNRLTNQKSQDLGREQTTRNQTSQDNIAARSNIDMGVRNTNTSLQRLLGAQGAGSSSAAQILAPFAAAQAGNQQRQQVQDAYGRNMSAIDQAITQLTGAYDDSFGDLGAQRDNQKNQLGSQIASTRQSLLGNKSSLLAALAQAKGQTYDQARAAINPITQQINDLGGQIDNYGRSATYTPKQVAYVNPDLAQYNYDPTGAPTSSGSMSNLSQLAGPYATLLGLNDKEKKLGSPLTAVA